MYVDPFGLEEWNGTLVVTDARVKIPGKKLKVPGLTSLNLVLYSPCVDGKRTKLWLKGDHLETEGLTNPGYALRTDVSFNDGGQHLVGQPIYLKVRGLFRNVVRLRIGPENSPVVETKFAEYGITAHGHFELSGTLTRGERPKVEQCDEDCE